MALKAKMVRPIINLILASLLSYQAINFVSDYLAFSTVQTIGILLQSPRNPMSVTFCDKETFSDFVSSAILTLASKDTGQLKGIQTPLLSKQKVLYCATYLSQLSSNQLEGRNMEETEKNSMNFFVSTKQPMTFTAVHSQTFPPQQANLELTGCFV